MSKIDKNKYESGKVYLINDYPLQVLYKGILNNGGDLTVMVNKEFDTELYKHIIEHNLKIGDEIF